ncbi:hypothetical protein KVR01_008102 [Diaporthe batatas]|uniref:uncharacterized protein n=1 Tax=Diaporthe batatas TaxID=748121 RepID=UPI001D04E01C|nr:uncharacterized protein KVR01_008102 [Diaporthe batatas]KAG8162337.1 hypothetical protein KVR01_008102 [Diaporthe batatas]
MAANKAVAALKGAFSSEQVVFPGSDEFTTLNTSYLSKAQGELEPRAIFLPADRDDVAKFVRFIGPYVLRGDIKFAVRGAGQQPALGCNNEHDGITVDLRNLSGIHLKDDHTTVSIGAGERWGEVYSKLQEKGLAVTGSRSSLGGIGGLSLSGGLSFFSSREGFITDNVTNFEVVLASGEITNANANENTDLFVSLRGGGNNFAIVTRYDMRTFKQGRFWGGATFYFPNSFPGQVEAYVKDLKDPEATDETHIMIGAGYSAALAQISDIMCMNQVYYTKEVENPPVLEPYVNMQPQIDQMRSVRMLDLVDAAKEQTAQGSSTSRISYMNTTVKADVPTLMAAYQIYVDSLGPLKAAEGLTTSFTLQAYPKSLLEKTDPAGGNSLGIDAQDGPLMSILILSFWQDKKDDDKIQSTFKAVIEAIDNDAATRGTAVAYKYMNYAAPFQDPIGSYGKENKARLQAASRKYDPEGLFQKGVTGGWKLFD